MLQVEPYATQNTRWPQEGRVILAQWDAQSVIVYQAYNPAIGRFAAEKGYFGGPFNMNRMTWIKPNFLWMMYRSGWGTKTDQEVTLAIRLKRSGFDEILASAVHSTFVPEAYASHMLWKDAVAHSHVRLQWDPDHDPLGTPLRRRAIQLGLRGPIVEKYAREWIVGIEDISNFVTQERELLAKNRLAELVTPSESVYPVTDALVSAKLGLGCHQ